MNIGDLVVIPGTAGFWEVEDIFTSVWGDEKARIRRRYTDSGVRRGSSQSSEVLLAELQPALPKLKEHYAEAMEMAQRFGTLIGSIEQARVVP